jgi:hypothetical protein
MAPFCFQKTSILARPIARIENLQHFMAQPLLHLSTLLWRKIASGVPE